MTSQGRSLSQWVEYIQSLHAREIDLSLERVNQVFLNLCPKGDPFKSVLIAGTNGKGSTAELLASVVRQAGYRVGKFTSPHLITFNERFNINGESVADSDLLAAFKAVEEARGSVPLTFFEFGTLIAIFLFAEAKVDLAVMEVGLGGRLDAVNILQPEVSVITSIAKDHTAWLGDSISEIAEEKFGVARADKPCILGMPEPPTRLLELAEKRDVELLRTGREFSHSWRGDAPDVWAYQAGGRVYSDLPLPFLQAGHQLFNAAAALSVLGRLHHLEIDECAVKDGLQKAVIQGRCQVVSSKPSVIIDVAHNEASVAALAEFMARRAATGRTLAVCGMLKDKEIEAALGRISKQIDSWFLASINDARGSSASEVAEHLRSEGSAVSDDHIQLFDQVEDAYEAARERLREDDCLVVFGSFFIAGDILAHHVKK